MSAGLIEFKEKDYEYLADQCKVTLYATTENPLARFGDEEEMPAVEEAEADEGEVIDEIEGGQGGDGDEEGDALDQVNDDFDDEGVVEIGDDNQVVSSKKKSSSPAPKQKTVTKGASKDPKKKIYNDDNEAEEAELLKKKAEKDKSKPQASKKEEPKPKKKEVFADSKDKKSKAAPKKEESKSPTKTSQFTERDNIISSKVSEMKSTGGTMDKLKGMVSKEDKNAKIDQGALSDLNELGVTGNNLSQAAASGNPRWPGFIAQFNSLFTSEVMMTEIEKPSEMIGLNKKAEDFLKSVDLNVFQTKDISLKGKVVRMREVQESISKRVAKITQYWSTGNKKNSLYIACSVASFMGICSKLKAYAYIFTQVVAVLEAFAKLVKSRFKRLIFEVNEASARKIKDGDFLGAKVSEAVLEIADNWNTFTGNVTDLPARVYIKSSLMFLNALKSEDHLIAEMKVVLTLLNGIMDPVIYAFAAAWFVYQIQPYKFKQNVDFMVALIFNFVAKIDLTTYTKVERFINPMFNLFFEWVDSSCSSDFKNHLLELCGDAKNGGLILCRLLQTMPQNYLQKNFKLIMREFLSLEDNIRVLIYPDLLKIMSQVRLKDTEIEKFVKLIPEINNFQKYVESLPHFLTIFSTHSDPFRKKELTLITFENLNSKMSLTANSLDRFKVLDGLFQKMIESKTKLSDLLGYEAFLNLLHYPQKETQFLILTAVLKDLNHQDTQNISDPILVYTILELSKNLTGDKLFESEQAKNKISSDLNKDFVKKVDFGKNIEETLNFLTKVKGQMPDKIPKLNELLLYKATELITKSFVWSRGNLNKKLQDFIQACSAFAFLGLSDLPPEKFPVMGINIAQIVLLSNQPALAENIFLKIVDNIAAKSKETKRLSFENKTVYFDGVKSLMNYTLYLPDSPESAHFKNLDTIVSTVRKMDLAGDDKLFFLEVLITAINILSILSQDKLPHRLRGVKSNDQLYKSPEYKEQLVEKLVGLFEELYPLLDGLKDTKGYTQLAETAHFCFRSTHILVNAFKDKAVINKTVKLLLTLGGDCIKEVKNKGEKRRTVRHLKRTIRECFLEDNPKLNKLASSLYTFFDENKPAAEQ